MILSVSRRTDIPAFYSEWFFNRVREGYVYVLNPFNRKQVSKVIINPEVIDCIVFWSKDPEPMLDRLYKLDSYKYYFQFTLNPYERDVEANLRNKKGIVNTFKKLSDSIGSDRVIWRYDPILLNSKYNKDYHYYSFERLCSELSGFTKKCVISFIDLYRKTEFNTKALKLQPLLNEDMYEISRNFVNISSNYNIDIEACSEALDLSSAGVRKGSCIDKALIEDIIDSRIDIKKDNTQRQECGCVKSIDIGQYNTCMNHCLYCYANFNYANVKENFDNHNPDSPLLNGKLKGDEKITDKIMKSIKLDGDFGFQQSLF